MNFYTSYYANFKNIPTNYLCVGISRYCPEGFLDELGNRKFPNFIWVKGNFMAPSEELLRDIKNGFIAEEQYKERYVREFLGNFRKFNERSDGYYDIPDWINDLSGAYSNYDAIVFMCYEAPDKFCHRHILAKLLTNVYGIPCSEIEINKKTKTTPECYSLF